MENNVQKTNGRKMTREEVINRMMAHQEERRLKAAQEEYEARLQVEREVNDYFRCKRTQYLRAINKR